MTNQFESLTPESRRHYLKAMGITQWVLRDSEEEQASVTESSDLQSSQLVKPHQATESLQTANFEQSPSETHSAQERAPLESSAEKTSQHRIEVVENSLVENNATENDSSESLNSESLNAKNASSENEVEKPIDTSKGFIKMVNWHSGLQGQDKILILCRHDKDQPAQSFAGGAGPSQFLTDYLQALKGFNQGIDKEFDILLGHLTEAGLGRDSLAFSSQVERIKPQLIVLMGEESIKHLLGKKSKVAELRGKVHMLDEDYHLLVTYHPFDMISHPPLKKLALEDLMLAKAFLSSQSIN